jgi:hypothetical protein
MAARRIAVANPSLRSSWRGSYEVDVSYTERDEALAQIGDRLDDPAS